MGNTLSDISGGMGSFNWNIGSSPIDLDNTISSSSSDSHISQLSEKEKSDLIASLLALTVPMIPPQELSRVFATDPDFFKKIDVSSSLGLAETALTFAVVDVWAKNLADIKQQVEEEQGSVFTRALEAFNQAHPTQISSENILQVIADVKDSPLLSAAFSIAQVDSHTLELAYQNAIGAIAISILDKWAEQIKELEELNKQRDRQKDLEIDMGKQLIMNFTDAVRAGQISLQSYEVTTMVIMASGLSFLEGVRDKNSGNVAFDVVQQMSQNAGQNLGYDYRMELSIIGASLAAAMAYQSIPLATLFTKVEGAQLQDKAKDAALAKGYALSVAALVLNPSFDAFLSVTVCRTPEGDPVGEETRQNMTNFVKVILLASALGALYKAEAGKITGAEFQALLSGQIPIQEGDMKGVILQLLNTYLEQLPQTNQSIIIQGLLEFLDTNPKMEGLIEPAKTFVGFYDTPSFQSSVQTA